MIEHNGQFIGLSCHYRACVFQIDSMLLGDKQEENGLINSW